MNRKNRIENLLKNTLIDFQFEIFDNSKEHIGHNNFDGTEESHFRLIIKKISTNNDSRLVIHRKINKILVNEFANGLHALEIKIIN